MSSFTKGTVLAFVLIALGVVTFVASFYALYVGLIADVEFVGGITVTAALLISALAFGVGTEEGASISRIFNILVLCGLLMITIPFGYAMIVAPAETSALLNDLIEAPFGPVIVGMYGAAIMYMIGAAFIQTFHHRAFV